MNVATASDDFIRLHPATKAPGKDQYEETIRSAALSKSRNYAMESATQATRPENIDNTGSRFPHTPMHAVASMAI